MYEISSIEEGTGPTFRTFVLAALRVIEIGGRREAKLVHLGLDDDPAAEVRFAVHTFTPQFLLVELGDFGANGFDVTKRCLQGCRARAREAEHLVNETLRRDQSALD
jgi:hypothetical protein